MMRFTPLVLLAAIPGCHAPIQSTREVALPSGKRVKVIAVGRVNFANDSPALMLKYETNLKISDVPALRDEVNEIWSMFKGDVEKADLANAIISANEVPQGFIVKNANGYNFVFRKQNGRWRLMSDIEKPSDKAKKQ
jgi:hypothetical protein